MNDENKKVNPPTIDEEAIKAAKATKVTTDQNPSKSKKKGASSGGAHAKKGQSERVRKSTRMRKVLIVVVILLVLLIAALGVFVFQLVTTAQDTAVQQTNVTDTDSIDAESTEKTTQSSTKLTTVPELVSLLGATQEEAIAQIGHGAEVTRSLPVNEEDNPVKTDVQIALTEEPSDSRTGTPTVYLSLDEAGTILQIGYSAATSSLGYGTLSFSDAVQNENVVEETLEDAGLTVSYGSAKLPEDKAEYQTYDSDGTTLVKEYCAFNGTGSANGNEYQWESILSYDYSMANATDNLNDTIRTIYIYIS